MVDDIAVYVLDIMLYYIYYTLLRTHVCHSDKTAKKKKDIFPIVSVDNNNNIYYIEIKSNKT